MAKKSTSYLEINDATVSLGYIGLYEAATAFFGPAWETNPEAKAFTLEIVEIVEGSYGCIGRRSMAIILVSMRLK